MKPVKNRYKIQNLKFGLKTNKPIGFIENWLAFLVYRAVFLKTGSFPRKPNVFFKNPYRCSFTMRVEQ
jgi:hypothetical protein